jgi:hypothetical protein
MKQESQTVPLLTSISENLQGFSQAQIHNNLLIVDGVTLSVSNDNLKFSLSLPIYVENPTFVKI